MNKNKAFLLALPAIGAAFLAVLSQLTFSIGPVPITLQTFAVGLIATIFKPREAVLSVFIYLLLGAIGLPVFAGGSGGFQALFGPSAGYLWFYLLFAFVTSSLTHKDSPFYMIFIAKPPIADAPYAAIVRDMERLMKKMADSKTSSAGDRQ